METILQADVYLPLDFSNAPGLGLAQRDRVKHLQLLLSSHVGCSGRL